MSFTNNSSSNLRKVSTRFDSLKSSEPVQKSAFGRNKFENNRHNNNRSEQQRKTSSSSTLFSVKNTSLADFIPGGSEHADNKKYVSPAMRHREQRKEARPHYRNEFADVTSKKTEKKKLIVSTTAFPSMGEPSHPTLTKQHVASSKYANAVAISDEDYQAQQRKSCAMGTDNTDYQDTDKLGNEETQTVCDEEHDNAADYSETHVDLKKPICPYKAGKSAMSMLRFHQYRRDELNNLLGGQSPYWDTKSLLDFTIDSGDDSDYHLSSSEEENNDDEDDY